MLGFQYFSSEAIWSPMFIFLTAAVIIAYYYFVGPWQLKHFPLEAQVSGSRKLLFVLAAILYYLANEGPFSLLGHIYFSFHMVNMAVSYLIVPPLILLAMPTYIWKLIFNRPSFKKLRFLMHPIFTAVFFNMSFSLYHLPIVHDYVMTNFVIHRLYYLIMLVAAFMMWWHIVSPVKEWNQLSHVKRMAYIFIDGVLLTPACALIIFSPEPMYTIYNSADLWVKAMGFCVPGDTSFLYGLYNDSNAFLALSKIEDQQLGGIVMKLLQELTFFLILAYVFKQWFKKEHIDEDAQNEHLMQKYAFENK